MSQRAAVSDVVRILTRPYRVTLPMVALVSLVPLYIFIAQDVRGRELHAPAVALDAMIPLWPAWSLVYGALYLFLIVLPVLVICDADLITRTVRAYLLIWLTAYAFFIAYPTVAPRPAGEIVPGTGFGVWGLQILYDADPPLNCFPSLHVAHSFVGAFAVFHMHRRLGLLAILCAVIVGLSTLFTKQHYVLDVVSGTALALLAAALFLKNHVREDTSQPAHRAAPVIAALLAAGIGVVVIAAAITYWVVAHGQLAR